MDPIHRLRERKVAQWVVAYCAGAWALIEVVDFLTARFDWPDGLIRGLAVLLAVGIVAVAVLAWFHGDRGAQRVSAVEGGLLVGLLVVGAAGAWAAGREPGDGGRRASGGAAAADPKSLVVLPFTNLSGNAEEDYFSDGVTEELINALSAVEGLRLVGRTSAFAFKGSGRDAQAIADALTVRHILDGSVRRSGERVRIAAQLVDAVDGFEVWSGSFDGDLSDILGLQREIAREIVGALRIELAAGSVPTVEETDPAAYDAYWRGRFYWRKRDVASLERALVLFQEAVDLDPTFAAAHAGLADTYAMLGAPSYSYREPRDMFRLARAAALRALELDSLLPEPHATLGFIASSYDWEWDTAEAHFRRAIELDPAHPSSRHWYSILLATLGRWPEALAQAERAHELDPLAGSIWGNVGRLHYLNRNHAEAIRYWRTALESVRMTTWPYIGIATAHLAQGDPASALAAADTATESFAGAREMVRGRALIGLGRTAEAHRILDELMQRSDVEYISPVYIALLLDALGERDEAFAWIERGYEERAGMLRFAAVEPLFDGLRADARFARILERMDLAPVTPP